MTSPDWMRSSIIAARPQAVAALLRYFRDLDTAEEAFQEACLRALKNWAKNGPPRDPAAWLIMVGRNAAIDAQRRTNRISGPVDENIPATADPEADTVRDIDEGDYRDDILRLMFVCCHQDLPATQQIALALRIVSGLTVPQIARAFLVSDSAMEQRITRAKSRIAKAGLSFETPGPVERAERVAAVAAVIYLLFNEGYTSGGSDTRQLLCGEAIRLARLLLRLFPSEPEIMGLTALLLLQQARSGARFNADGEAVLLDQQDRTLWNGAMIAEALALVDKAMRRRSPGPYQVQAAIAALHARAQTAADTDWPQIELLYGALERLQPSPIVTLNRAVAVYKARGPAEALEMVEPLGKELANYFYFHGTRGLLLEQAGRRKEAADAYGRAIALANNAAEAAHIRAQLDRFARGL